MCAPKNQVEPHPLAQWRQAQGLTQTALARRLGVLPSAISRYEAGRQIPAREIMLRILAVTDGAVPPGAFYAHSWLAAPLTPEDMARVERCRALVDQHHGGGDERAA